ncbi:MAG: phosphoenolpyruvate--protein phosphotransferase [Gammaproteobacteria bacterium]
MLKLLRRILQDVSSAENLREALNIGAQRIKAAIETDACSIFITHRQLSEYVLAATEGLNQKLIGKVRIKFGEGLVGLVGEREQPINLDEAMRHPRFLHYQDLGEEQYHAFLGVPIINQREVLGIITVQQQASRRFDEAEEAILITIAAQLANVIAIAQASGEFPWETSIKDKVLNGMPGAPGIAIGQARVVYPLADLDAVPDREAENIETEIANFCSALQETQTEMRALSQNIAISLAAEEQALFNAYLQILSSASLVEEVTTEIRSGSEAQAALKRVIKRHVMRFESVDDPYLRERAADFKDLGQRILFQLQAKQRAKPSFPRNTILVGEEIAPAALAEVPEGHLVGVVTAQGSANSHVAILARAMGIPIVMSAQGLPLADIDEQELIVDGYYGQVYLAPSASVRSEFEALVKEEQELDVELRALRDLPAETTDGHHVPLYLNIGPAVDVGRSLTVGAEGVGLYRTEVPFMARERFPSEEEQRVIYRQLLNSFAPRPVMMRTLDIGGDKALPYFPIEENNPFLGWRGIRLTLDHPEIFLVQVRAMLRASTGLNNLHILLPMVSHMAEVEEAWRLIHQAHSELMEEKLPISMPKLGIMVEVPSVIYQIQELAQRVDFLSVGSNDLTQYLLAVDRNNTRVANLYDSLHPAVLRALQQIVRGVHKEKKRVSICGEMAGDPASVILLLAMGFDSLSMNATRLPRIKWVIRNFSLSRAKELLEEVLTLDDPMNIRNHIELALEETGLGGLVRAGR